MQTFKEWADENHPEDEVINEFLGDLARRAANSKTGRAAIAAGALALGTTGSAPEAKGAMPQVPIMDSQADFSEIPFNKNIGPRPEGPVSDYDLYYHQIKRVDEFLKEKERGSRAGKQIAMPIWYMKMGDHYKWKRPKPPEFSEREQAYAKFMAGKHSEDQKQMMTNLYNGTK